MIERIEHVGIGVRDLEKAKDFYRELLGFEVYKELRIELPKIRGAAFMRKGDDIIELVHMPDSEVPDAPYEFLGCHHICFSVSDFAGEVARWQEMGVTSVVPPTHALDGGMRTTFRGPGGEYIELRGS